MRPSFSFLKQRIAGWERAVYHFAEWLKGEVNGVEKAKFHAKAGPKTNSFPIRKQKDEIRYRFQDGPSSTQRALELRRPERQQKLPQLLPATVLTRFFQVIEECGDVQHEIMLKLLFYTAIRVSELVRIETTDVDLDHCKIFIDRGKGQMCCNTFLPLCCLPTYVALDS